MQQHLGRLEGVDKVTVSLADGSVVILAKPDSQLDPAKVFKATYDSGVSVAEMTMEATGSLERNSEGHVVFRLSGSQIYPVAETETIKPFLDPQATEKVFVRARVFKKTGKQKQKTLGAVLLEMMEIRKSP